MKIKKYVLQSLKDALNNTGHNVVRIEIKGLGSDSPEFGVILDEQRSDDIVFEDHGIEFAVKKDLALFIMEIQALEIVETDEGFEIVSEDDCCC